MVSEKEKTCSFCAETILKEAKKCKHCGSMLDKQATTIELTSKSIKMQMIVSIVVFIWGWIISFAGGSLESDIWMTIGILMIVGGTGSFIWAKIAKWWHHS